MPAIILKHIRGDKLSDVLKKIKPDPNKTFRLTLEPEIEYKDHAMPSEEKISDELIKAVKKSEKSHMKGHFTRCETGAEIDGFFNDIKNPHVDDGK
ncbi:MAG: hypothetical protein ACUZ8H_07160 [Candidatus Anammoxibacter sp.]